MARRRKLRVGLAGISFTNSFWGFKQEQYKKRIEQLREVVAQLDYKLEAIGEAFEDHKGAKAAAKKLNDVADIVILDIATYPEGKAVNAFFDELRKPLVLWSRDESIHNSNIGHNSFCGANFLGGCLTLRGMRFRQLYGSSKSKEFKSRLATACKLVDAANAAAGSKIGLFGEGIVPKFYDIDINGQDRKKLQDRWAISFVPVTLDDLIKRTKSYDDAQIEKEAARFGAYFDRVKVDGDALKKQARLIRAVREFCREGNFASTAFRCWPELQQMYEFWPCPTLSILNETGIPAACEGDLGGALDMLLAKYMSDSPSTLVDIVDWDNKADTFAIWHCGPTAPSWADKNGTTLIRHDVDGKDNRGRAAFGYPGIVDMQFEPGKVSVFRTLGAIDDEFVVEGNIIRAPKKNICGCWGAVGGSKVHGQKKTAEDIRRNIFERTLPHHYTAARGHIFS